MRDGCVHSLFQCRSEKNAKQADFLDSEKEGQGGREKKGKQDRAIIAT